MVTPPSHNFHHQNCDNNDIDSEEMKEEDIDDDETED
jgi:hypothetical protein